MKRGCPSGYVITAKGDCRQKNWRELDEGESFHGIINSKESHWGKGQTGMSLCIDGSFDVSKNKPKYERKYAEGHIKSIHGGMYFPTHRTLKTGKQRGCYPAIYSFAWPADRPGGTIWLYPYAENAVADLRSAMCAFMGKYGSSEETKVKSNTSRKLLFTLGGICR